MPFERKEGLITSADLGAGLCFVSIGGFVC